MLGESLGTANSSFRSARWIWPKINHPFFLFNHLFHQICKQPPGAARSVSGWCRKRTCWQHHSQAVCECSEGKRQLWVVLQPLLIYQNEPVSFHMMPVYFVCISACIVIYVLEVFSVMFNMILAETEPCRTKGE